MKTYTARARRSGDWWAIDVPEIAGVHTQARRLDQVEDMARDAIALFLDVPNDSFNVNPDIVVPAFAEAPVAKLENAVRALHDAERTAADARHNAAVALVKGERLTLRDAGTILGLSFQRVQQLIEEAQSPRRAAARSARLYVTAGKSGHWDVKVGTTGKKVARAASTASGRKVAAKKAGGRKVAAKKGRGRKA